MNPRVISEQDLEQLYQNMALVRATTALKPRRDGTSGGDRRATDVAKRPGHRQLDKPSPSPLAPFQLALIGQHISGKNRVGIRRDGHHYPQKQFINWRAQAHIQLLEQARPLETITVPVKLSCWYWPSDERTRDVTGMQDALFYLLVYANILKNDGLIWDCSWKRYPKTKFPKLILVIESWEK